MASEFEKSSDKYNEFILKRSKNLVKNVPARLAVVEELYEMIKIAKKDYQNKHAIISKLKISN